MLLYLNEDSLCFLESELPEDMAWPPRAKVSSGQIIGTHRFIKGVPISHHLQGALGKAGCRDLRKEENVCSQMPPMHKNFRSLHDLLA